MPFSRHELNRMIGERKSRPTPFCLSCGYNLTGAVSDRCPECGHHFNARDWQRELEYVERLLREYRVAGQWLRIALGAVLVGAALYLFSLLAAGSCLGRSLRVLAAVLGFGGALQGVGIFRMGRLPLWARENLTEKPRYELAVCALFLGLLVGSMVLFGP